MTLRYADRAEAGRLLAQSLGRHRDQPCVIYALPRGGVPIGYEIARALKAPLDLMLVRKIGVPFQPELAMGAVADGEPPVVVLNDDIVAAIGPGKELIAEATARECTEIARRRALYLGGRAPLSAAGRVAIVVDDGLATGATARAALRALKRQKPSRLILAIPVAPAETVAALKAEADEIVCPQIVEDFIAVGAYYRNFRQVEDDEVKRLLVAAATPGEPAGGA
jgi:putative phosphoribosyl transferase